MIMRSMVASVVGQVSDTRWGQVLQTPHAYGVVEIYSMAGIARQRGIHTLSELTKEFDIPPVSLAQLQKIAENAVQHKDIISLILLVPVGTTLFIVSRGAGRVYLKRGNKLALLADGSQSLSGDIQHGDAIIAATEGFVSTLSSQEIIRVFDHASASEVAEKLTIRLHEKDVIREGGAALIYHISNESTKDSEHAQIQSEETNIPQPIAPSGFFRMKVLGRRLIPAKWRASLRYLMWRAYRYKKHLSKRFVVVITVLILCGIGTGVWWQYTRRVHMQSDLTETLIQARRVFDEGLALFELNPVKGRERLIQARDILKPIASRNFQTKEGREAVVLYEEISQGLIRAMRIYDVSPELFFDVSLLKSGASVSDISLFEDTIALLDGSSHTIFTLGVKTKSGTIVGGGPAFAGATQITAYGEYIYVYAPSGVHAVRLSDTKALPGIIPKATEWGNIVDLTAYGGNMYLLDIEKHRIWKYISSEKGFDGLFEYLNPDFFPDLSHAMNMSIDGSVWLGSRNGTVTRFTSGALNTYALQGEDMPPGDAVHLYVSDSTRYVYVLDMQQYRVIVYDKDGLYIAQYRWENGLPATQLVVSENTGKIFLLAQGKLYTITLQ